MKLWLLFFLLILIPAVLYFRDGEQSVLWLLLLHPDVRLFCLFDLQSLI